MTVTSKQLSVLGGIALAMVVLTVVLYGTGGAPPTEFQKGTPLIQGLDFQKVTKITVTKNDKTVTLERRGKRFVVAERDGYPAATKKVNELVSKCYKITCAEEITDSRDSHKDLGVTEDSEDATVVSFYGDEVSASQILIAYRGAKDASEAVERPRTEAKKLAEKVLKEAKAKDADFAALAEKYSDGPSKAEGGNLGTLNRGEMPEKFDQAAWGLEIGQISGVVETPLGFHIIRRTGGPLVGFVVGKSAAHGSGYYVRLLGQDTVYASKESFWISTDATSQMETDIVSVKKEDTKEVRVQLKDEAYTLSRDKDDKIVLDKVPKGKQSKSSDLDSVFTAFSSVYFSDVMRAEKEKLDWDATYVCETKKHLTYTAQLAKKGDKHYMRIAVEGPSAALIEKNRRIRTDKSLPKEEMEKRDAVLTAADKAVEFNDLHRGWAYEISSWKAENMRKPIKDLVEDIPKPKEPEEISASHILIAYKGAKKADAKITRTKDEAKKRAEEALKKAKEKDADFAALAKEYSDGPTKDKGGDLGSFKKGKMDEKFDEAAWKLEVDEISDVVETPFGFHIIKRTK